MAKINHNDKYFSEQTKSKFVKNCSKIFWDVFLNRWKMTEEEVERLGCERKGNVLRFYDTSEYRPTPVPNPIDITFDGNSNGSRTLFGEGLKPTYQLNINQNIKKRQNMIDLPPAATLPEPALAATNLPVPAGPTFGGGGKCDLTISPDKILTLVLHNFNHEELVKPLPNHHNVTSTCNDNKSNKAAKHYNCCSLDMHLDMGARTEEVKVICFNNDQNQTNEGSLVVKTYKVLKIENKNEFEEEIYLRGQIGAFGVKSENIDQDIFRRHIQCGKYIYPINFHDFYIYNTVGVVCDPLKNLISQWPWIDPETSRPVDPNNQSDKATYEFLIKKIDLEADRDEFFKVFSNLINGNFCNFISDKKYIMQLALALVFSEQIRNFQTIEWNKLLNDHQNYIITHKDLRDVLCLHPMVVTGSFQKRRTGYKGKTPAASKKVDKFKEELERPTGEFSAIGLPQRQQDGDDSGDLPVSYRPQ